MLISIVIGGTYAPPRYRTSQYRRTFIPWSVSLWNDLSDPVFDGVGTAHSLLFSVSPLPVPHFFSIPHCWQNDSLIHLFLPMPNPLFLCTHCKASPPTLLPSIILFRAMCNLLYCIILSSYQSVLLVQ